MKRFDELSATITFLKTAITQQITENAQLRKENTDLKNCQELNEKYEFLMNY